MYMLNWKMTICSAICYCQSTCLKIMERMARNVLQLLNKHSQFVCKIGELLLIHMSVLKILQSFIARRGRQCSWSMGCESNQWDIFVVTFCL